MASPLNSASSKLTLFRNSVKLKLAFLNSAFLKLVYLLNFAVKNSASSNLADEKSASPLNSVPKNATFYLNLENVKCIEVVIFLSVRSTSLGKQKPIQNIGSCFSSCC